MFDVLLSHSLLILRVSQLRSISYNDACSVYRKEIQTGHETYLPTTMNCHFLTHAQDTCLQAVIKWSSITLALLQD